MSCSQLQREFCVNCNAETIHRVLSCIHCGTVRSVTKNNVEWFDDHTPKVWNLKRRSTPSQTYGERLRAKAARRHKARLRQLAARQTISE